MSQFIIDLFFALIFIVLGILLMRIKDRAFTENRESYRYSTSGVFVLFLVSIIRLLNHQQAFASVPFLSEPICRDLIEATGIIAGMTLMLAGVSFWLPVRKKQTAELEEELNRHSAIQKLEWEINGTEKIRRLFEIIPESVCNHFGFIGAAVFLKPSHLNKFICYYSHNSDFSIGSRTIAYENSQSGCGSIKNTLDDLKANCCITISINDKILGYIFFWNEGDRRANSDDTHALEKISRMLSARLEREFIMLKGKFFEDNWYYLTQVRKLIASRADLKENLHDFSVLFKYAVGSDYFSLAVLDKARMNMRRYTTGINRRILLEDGVRLPIDNTQIATVIKSHESLLIRDITHSKNTGLDSLFLSCGQSSMIAVPIINHGRVIACMTLGCALPGHFTRRDLLRVETMAAAMAPAIEANILNASIHERDRYLGALASFDSLAEKGCDTGTVLKAAADILMENVGTTMVRISMIDSDRSRLNTKALKLIRPFDNINSNPVSLSRELTPWHYIVSREGRLLLINQKDPEASLDDIEAKKLVFKDVNSTLIIPIVVNGITQGFITLGEMRNWNRFAYDSTVILFCKQVASRLASFIKLYNISRLLSKTQVTSDMEKIEKNGGRNIIRDIKGPLTRLRGSIDLLKLRHGADDDESDKVLLSIDESADYITSLVNDTTEQ